MDFGNQSITPTALDKIKHRHPLKVFGDVAEGRMIGGLIEGKV